MSDFRHQRKVFQDISGSTVLAATDDLSSTARTLVAAKTGYSICIQAITIVVITDNAATLTFQDDASTPVVIHKTKASPGLGTVGTPPLGFGSEGRRLTEAKNFTLKNSAAGLAADIHWEGYRRPTAAVLLPSQV